MFDDHLFTGVRLLWAGAHPDDELFVAPLLGQVRERFRAAIRFLVATRGERGPCYRPEGCGPDLAQVREKEMGAAASVFGGTAAFLGCRDGSAPRPDQVLYHWENDSGGADSLRRRFLDVYETFRPDIVLTLDPDHGSTSHADHRAIGMLTASIVDNSRLWFAESAVRWGPDIHIGPADASAEEIEAGEWWHYLISDLRCHRSQMRQPTIDAFARVPAEERKVWVRKAAG